jgi:branched-chain amino acid transport system ATP-binding protein
MLLELDEVVLDYGAVRAVDHVGFGVEAGEVCGLVGPNGSGKSSLLNTISGFVTVTSGKIGLDGADLTRERPHVVARHGVGRTFQLVRLLRGLTVEDNIAAGYFSAAIRSGLRHTLSSMLSARKLAGDEKERVGEAMELAGVTHLADVHVEELSFGMQRRVEVARSIVSRPRLLLFDEPAAGLDTKDLEDLSAIIRRESERGAAVILVDHHLHFVLELCPRLVVLNFGNKIFDGPGEDAVKDAEVREAYVGS